MKKLFLLASLLMALASQQMQETSLLLTDKSR